MEAHAAAPPPCFEITLDNLFEFPQGRRVLSCIQCGMCAGTCPYGDVMDYPPRRIIAMLRAGLLEKVFQSDGLLACVACYACMAKCPRDIRLTEVLLPLVKEQVFLNLPETPAELHRALENTLRYGNPAGEAALPGVLELIAEAPAGRALRRPGCARPERSPR